MNYEKPQLMVLSLAADTIRLLDGSGEHPGKAAIANEHGQATDSDAGNDASSSTGGAYEADE